MDFPSYNIICAVTDLPHVLLNLVKTIHCVSGHATGYQVFILYYRVPVDCWFGAVRNRQVAFEISQRRSSLE